MSERQWHGRLQGVIAARTMALVKIEFDPRREGQPTTKEALMRFFPVWFEGTRAALAEALEKVAHCLVMGDREHERQYLGEAARLRWQLDQAWEMYEALPRLPHEVVPGEVVACFNADAASAARAWWTAEEQRRADVEMQEALAAARSALPGELPLGSDLLRARAKHGERRLPHDGRHQAGDDPLPLEAQTAVEAEGR